MSNERKVALNTTVYPEDMERWVKLMKVEKYEYAGITNADIFKKLLDTYKKIRK